MHLPCRQGLRCESIYNTVKTVYDGETFIPLNPRSTKASEAISAGNPICEAGLAMHKDGKTTDGRGGFGRNTAAPSASPKPAFAPATTKTGTMGRKTRVVPSIRPFQQTTDFPLTGNACVLSVSMPCVQSVKDTTPALRRLGRNDYGCAMEPARQTSIRWLISPL